MNIRKAIDYDELFEAVDRVVNAVLPQMELYREIGRLICKRPEKGAAAAVARHLQNAYPDTSGFSPRNVRRMRDFCLAYEVSPDLMDEAMQLGWTQNLVIMESNLALDERGWYLRTARQHGWSKQELIQRIAENAHTNPNFSLDTSADPCYTDSDNDESEENGDQGAFLLPREYMPQPDGGVCDERSGEESRVRKRVSHRIRSLHQRGLGQSRLFPGPPRVDQPRHRLHRENSTAAHIRGLPALRFTDRHGRRKIVFSLECWDLKSP